MNPKEVEYTETSPCIHKHTHIHLFENRKWDRAVQNSSAAGFFSFRCKFHQSHFYPLSSQQNASHVSTYTLLRLINGYLVSCLALHSFLGFLRFETILKFLWKEWAMSFPHVAERSTCANYWPCGRFGQWGEEPWAISAEVSIPTKQKRIRRSCPSGI